MNIMKQPVVEKLTLNIGAGKDQNKLEKGIMLIKHISGVEPIKTITNKRIPGWGLRPGLPIGCKLTLRNKQAVELLRRLLVAKENILSQKQFDDSGNLSFGLKEYLDIPGVKYEPKIGVMGFEACVTLGRPGFRIKRRSRNKAKVGKKHLLSKQDAIDFMKKEYNIKIKEEVEEQ